ncbi:hypothetical protein F4680DRAFT_461013 [Xylaria scruposa]|nr:hypothetical protein F4680DRAFT_461013 [Xylaria scruposa]
MDEQVCPRYAILSHTWRDGEAVTSEDLLRYHEAIDTCCIDKRSSTELSEAINSMFKWYQNAAQCYAFLQDVTGSVNDPSFQDNRWFTRGWTLQELIAPKRLSFYNQSWKAIGTIFGVNMPRLYGEGYKVFIRLQEVIISQKFDHSILTWETI